MAKEVIVRELCDVCLEDDEKVDGTAIPPVYLTAPRGGMKPRILALCDPHRAQYWLPLYDLVMRLGQPYDAETTAPVGPTTGTRPNSARGGTSNGVRTRGAQFIAGPFKCEIPGCDKRPNKNLSAFGQHLWSQHRLNITIYRQKIGEPRRVDGTPAYTYDETGRPVLYPHPANDDPAFFTRRKPHAARSANEESQDVAALAEKAHVDPPADDADPYACTICDKYTGAGLKSPAAGLRSHMYAKHPERMRAADTPLAGVG